MSYMLTKMSKNKKTDNANIGKIMKLLNLYTIQLK